MKKIGTIMLGLMVATTMLSACKKKEVAGPAGPAGPAGNANVKSVIFETSATDWAGNGVNGYQFSAAAPIITPSIFASGAVMCYIQWGGGDFMALPYSYLNGSYTRHMLFTYSEAVINVNIRDDDGLTSNPGNSNSIVKVVAISSTGLIQNPDLDLTDYEAVEKAFDL